MKITVLGAGRVGHAIALDLAGNPDFEITAADLSAENLERLQRVAPRRGSASAGRVHTLSVDLADSTGVQRAIADADLVVGAMPSVLGFATARTVLEAGKNLVDISFFVEDPFGLDELARERGVVAIVDCGIAPGMSNLLLGKAIADFDRVEDFLCYVGGLPERRVWPFEYKAPFAPGDVIEEYTRPTRLMENGRVVTRPALSEQELVDLPGVGTLEAFNTDGLRTLLTTVDVPSMKEKTLRYPGHAERMRMLREAGFFSTEPLRLGDAEVRPLDLTARLLFKAWHLEDDEDDLTVMRVEIEGTLGGGDGGDGAAGRRERRIYDLLDRRDPETGISSMARTTGYTATAAAALVAEGRYTRTGISPPELVGQHPGCAEAVLAHLAARGVVFRERVERP